MFIICSSDRIEEHSKQKCVHVANKDGKLTSTVHVIAKLDVPIIIGYYRCVYIVQKLKEHAQKQSCTCLDDHRCLQLVIFHHYGCLIRRANYIIGNGTLPQGFRPIG